MCVQPILTISLHAFDFAAMASRRADMAGTKRSFTLTAAAIYMVDGNESFDDRAMLT
jgi:hypothetical protein